MLRKDKEKKKEGADSFNTLYTLVSCSQIKTLQFNIQHKLNNIQHKNIRLQVTSQIREDSSDV